MDHADSFQYTPQITLQFEIGEKDFFVAGESASRVKKTLQQLGLRQEVIKRVAVVIYEAAMNVAIHADSGVLRVNIDPEKITLETEDRGPGIPDVDLAMKEGYSTASPEVREMGFGAGMGLSNIKQNSDEMVLETRLGAGTTLITKVYLNPKT